LHCRSQSSYSRRCCEVQIEKGVKIGANSDLRASRLILGQGSEIGSRCRVLVAETFQVGKASRISVDFSATCRSFCADDFLYIGHECHVGYGGTTESNSTVTIGREVALGPHCILNANYPIVLKDKVGTGGYVTFWTHGFHFGHSALDGFPPTFEPITINSNVWLGYHVTVLPGVIVGENTIVAGGSVITGGLPANCLAAGVPAKFKKDLAVARLTVDDCHTFITDVLMKWQAELRWKGLRVESSLENSDYPSLTTWGIDNTKYSICLLHPNAAAPTIEQGKFVIVLSVNERADLKPEQSSNLALFEIRARKLRGSSNEVVEDLRDFLRRHTLCCGTDRVFESIEPVSFQRLKMMV
jgi:acetyltransferase-like isoleucine patch superfamily enzyme